MISSIQAIERSLARVPDVGFQVARYLGPGANPALALVQFGTGAPVEIPAVGVYPPWPGDSVQIERRNGQMVMNGPTVAKSPLGKITAAGTPKATVTVGGVAYTLPVRNGYTAVVGDDVTVNWVTQIIEGKNSTTVTPPVVDPGAGGAATPFDLTFQAQDSGSWNGSRYYLNDVQASDSIMGAWWYGSVIVDTLARANITSLEIYLPLIQELGVARIGVHLSASKPGGWVGSASEIDMPGRSGWVSLPPIYGAQVRDNGGGFTVTSGNGLNRWRGTQSDGLSGALRFRGTK